MSGVWQLVDQEEIHNQCLSNNSKERINALDQLRDNFPSLTDKQQAWNDLHKLTNDASWSVRSSAASVLGSVYSDVPDKQQAWNDLIKLTADENGDVGYFAASALISVHSDVSDKQQAWSELIRLTNNEDGEVRLLAASALGSAFSHVPDKQQAWNGLIKLTIDEDIYVRSKATEVLDSAFFQMPDKQQAWNDLIKLTFDKDSNVRSRAAEALNYMFSQVPDKQQAWNDLHKLISDEDSEVRFHTASTLGTAFSHIPVKEHAWNDLHRLINDASWSVRSSTVRVLGSVFSQVPDKQQAWDDLHRLTDDEDNIVRSNAASALGYAYSQVLDKQQAWNDLHKLTLDEDIEVIGKAAIALGSVFSQVPDKQQARDDLHRLASNKDNYVRTFSNYSLGRVSIFRASQANKEEDYKKELEKAIEYFEKAVPDSPKGDNPSKFCLPFYRSFHTVIFKKQAAKEEVDKYLAEAKDAIEESKSKKMLFEAVENLANALKDVQNLENPDLETKKGELNFYRIYCDRAAELMIDTEKTAPFATITLRKGLPILDRNLKELLEEIQKKAKIACKESKGTNAEGIACAVSKEVQKWEIGSQEEMTQNIEGMIETFRMRMPHLPGYEHIFEEIEGIRNINDLAKQYNIISRLVGLIPIFSSMPDHLVQDIRDIKDNTTDIKVKLDIMDQKMNNIRFGIFKLKLNSHNVISNLDAMKIELEKLNEVESLNVFSIEKLNSIQINKLNELNKDIVERLDEIKVLIYEFSEDNDEFSREFSKRLDKLKQSKLDMLLQTPSEVATLISFVVWLHDCISKINLV